MRWGGKGTRLRHPGLRGTWPFRRRSIQFIGLHAARQVWSWSHCDCDHSLGPAPFRTLPSAVARIHAHAAGRCLMSVRPRPTNRSTARRAIWRTAVAVLVTLVLFPTLSFGAVAVGARRLEPRGVVHGSARALAGPGRHRHRRPDVHVRRGRRQAADQRHRVRRRPRAVRRAVPDLAVLNGRNDTVTADHLPDVQTRLPRPAPSADGLRRRPSPVLPRAARRRRDVQPVLQPPGGLPAVRACSMRARGGARRTTRRCCRSCCARGTPGVGMTPPSTRVSRSSVRGARWFASAAC